MSSASLHVDTPLMGVVSVLAHLRPLDHVGGLVSAPSASPSSSISKVQWFWVLDFFPSYEILYPLYRR